MIDSSELSLQPVHELRRSEKILFFTIGKKITNKEEVESKTGW